MRAVDRFANRTSAGRALAERLVGRRLEGPIVLALPRGGVPVAAEIARALAAPLELAFVRKIGVPLQPELAAAAVIDGGDPELVINDDVVAAAAVGDDYIRRQVAIELAEIERRRQAYGVGRARVALDGRTLVLVDDGIATGASVRAAIVGLKRKTPRSLVLAVPVAPADTITALRPLVDELLCLETPHPFYAIGLHYRDFHQVSDGEVIALLRQADAERPSS